MHARLGMRILTEPGPEGTPLGSECGRLRHLVSLLFRGPLLSRDRRAPRERALRPFNQSSK